MTLTESIQELIERQVEQTTLLKIVRGDLAEIKVTLHGEPGREKHGLVTRVRDLEVWDRMKNKVLWLLGGTLIGGITTFIASKL